MADDNRPLKYLRYAIGEIALVVIGILIALQINNWNEERRSMAKEKNLLLELKVNLETNISNLENDIERQIQGADSLDLLIDHLENKRPYNDSLATIFVFVDQVPDIILASSAFETLKSIGIQILSSRNLRQEIINLFEITYPYLLQETKRIEDQVWPSTVVPLYQKHFRFKNGKAVPTDYNLLLADNEFINMLSFRAQLRKESTIHKKKTVQKTQEVIELIGKELNK